MRLLAGIAALIAVAVLVAVAAEDKDKKKDKDDVIVINIKGKGGKSKFIKEGDDDQKDVTVTVGQTVKWVNVSNAPHTATCDVKANDKPIFRTPEMDPDDKDKKSASVTFDKQKYDDAGGKDGKPVDLPYHCEIHPSMKSKIILKPADKKDK